MLGLETQALTFQFAFILGALHALEPGHGKTAMLAYMLGGRRNVWHAVLMGVGSALSHSLSIFLIAGLTHVAAHLLTEGHLENSPLTRPFEWISAGLIFGIGIYLLVEAMREHEGHPHCCAHHAHKESPAFSKRHSNEDHRGYRVAALLGLGGGLMPCPSALAAFLSGMASGNSVQALSTIAVFAVGVATSLVAVGVALRYLGQRFADMSISPKRRKLYKCLHSLLILGVGSFYLWNMMR